MSSNRLALLCLSGSRPTFTLATTSANSLHIISVETPTADIQSLKALLDEKLPAFKQKSVTLYVDDPSGIFDDYGYKCSLSAKEHDGVGVLKRSLSRYFALHKAGGITLPKNSHGFEIQPSIINERVKDSGEGYYQVDWAQLEDNARAALLLIHCAFSQDLHQASFVKSMYAALGQIEGSETHSSDNFMLGLSQAKQSKIERPAIDALRRQGRRIL